MRRRFWIDFDPLPLPPPLDAAAARVFGEVAADIRSIGRKTAARSYDALIAAISLANDLPLYTVNPNDFEGIRRLKLVEIPHPHSTT